MPVALVREIECVVHRTRGMGLRDVKRTEIVPVILNLRSRRHGETEVREYFGEFVHHLTDCMHRSLRLDRRRQSHIQLLGSQARIRSEESTSELQSLMRNSYAVFYSKNKTSICVFS